MKTRILFTLLLLLTTKTTFSAEQASPRADNSRDEQRIELNKNNLTGVFMILSPITVHGKDGYRVTFEVTPPNRISIAEGSDENVDYILSEGIYIREDQS